MPSSPPPRQSGTLETLVARSSLQRTKCSVDFLSTVRVLDRHFNTEVATIDLHIQGIAVWWPDGRKINVNYRTGALSS